MFSDLAYFKMFLSFCVLDDFFRFSKKIGFLGILGPPYYGIGATIRLGREMLCLPYAGFFSLTLVHLLNYHRSLHHIKINPKLFIPAHSACSIPCRLSLLHHRTQVQTVESAKGMSGKNCLYYAPSPAEGQVPP